MYSVTGQEQRPASHRYIITRDATLTDILEAINAVERFTAAMDFEQFQCDEKTTRAVERELEIIGEAVKKIPAHITAAYSSVPWRAIAGMRDHLVHYYWDTEATILWSTVEDSLPDLKARNTRNHRKRYPRQTIDFGGQKNAGFCPVERLKKGFLAGNSKNIFQINRLQHFACQ